MRGALLGCALLLACAGPPPRVADLPLRDASTCGIEAAPVGALDVAVAIDASRSAGLPSGHDIDLDGVVGVPLDARSSDPHDSRLAAQVAGVRALLVALDGSGARFSIVAVSGRSHAPTRTQPLGRIVDWRQARVRTPLTGDRNALERGLDAVLATGGEGRTDFAAGMNLAIRTLQQASGLPGTRRRAALFLTDSSTPVVAALKRTYPYPATGGVDHLDPLMRQEAVRALRNEVSFHTFAMGPAADDPTPHPLMRIATATGGGFHRVDDPARLHCELLAELARVARTPPPWAAGRSGGS